MLKKKNRNPVSRFLANHRAARWFLVVAWMSLIFGLSATPDLKSGLESSWDLILRKLAHVAEYAVLSWLIAYALSNRKSRLSLGQVVLILGVSFLYSVSDEWHQTLVPGRHGAWLDVIIDTFGSALGIIVFQRRR